MIVKKSTRRFNGHNGDDEGEIVCLCYSFFDRPCCPIKLAFYMYATRALFLLALFLPTSGWSMVMVK